MWTEKQSHIVLVSFFITLRNITQEEPMYLVFILHTTQIPCFVWLVILPSFLRFFVVGVTMPALGCPVVRSNRELGVWWIASTSTTHSSIKCTINKFFSQPRVEGTLCTLDPSCLTPRRTYQRLSGSLACSSLLFGTSSLFLMWIVGLYCAGPQLHKWYSTAHILWVTWLWACPFVHLRLAFHLPASTSLISQMQWNTGAPCPPIQMLEDLRNHSGPL